MKNPINLLIAIMIFLSSCSSVEFKEVAPKKGEKITEFPKKMIGKYLDAQSPDTLTITSNYYKIGKQKKMFFSSGKLSQKNTILKKFNNYYLLNLRKEKEHNWSVFPFTFDQDKITIYYFLLDKNTKDKKAAKEFKEKKIKELRLITNVEQVRDTADKVYNYLINPTDKEVEKIFDKGLYKKIFEFNRIK